MLAYEGEEPTPAAAKIWRSSLLFLLYDVPSARELQSSSDYLLIFMTRIVGYLCIPGKLNDINVGILIVSHGKFLKVSSRSSQKHMPF